MEIAGRSKLRNSGGRWGGGGKGTGPAFLHPAGCSSITQLVLCPQMDIICARLHDTVRHFHAQDNQLIPDLLNDANCFHTRRAEVCLHLLLSERQEEFVGWIDFVAAQHLAMKIAKIVFALHTQSTIRVLIKTTRRRG